MWYPVAMHIRDRTLFFVWCLLAIALMVWMLVSPEP